MRIRLSLTLFTLVLASCSGLEIGEGYRKGSGSYKGLGTLSPSQKQSRNSMPKGPLILAWPVKHPQISQKFSGRSSELHHGLDIRGKKGTPILSAHDGFVVYTGRRFSGYGKMIILEYNDSWATLYAHLNKIRVREGQSIKRGERLGDMGRTGRTTGVHLHFELLHNKQPTDPLKYLKKLSGEWADASTRKSASKSRDSKAKETL